MMMATKRVTRRDLAAKAEVVSTHTKPADVPKLQVKSEVTDIKANFLKLLDKNGEKTELQSLKWSKESESGGGGVDDAVDEETTEEETDEEDKVQMRLVNGKAGTKRRRLVFESWSGRKRQNFRYEPGRLLPPPRKLIKIDRQQTKDNEQRPLPQLLKQVLVSYPAEGAHYSLVLGRDLISLGSQGSPLSGNLIRFGLHYIFQRKVCPKMRSSVVLFDCATFGSIDRYPKLREAEKRKFRMHHQLGDKEFLVFLVRMANPGNQRPSTSTSNQLNSSHLLPRPLASKRGGRAGQGKVAEDNEEDEIDEYIFVDDLEKEKEEREELGVRNRANGSLSEEREDAENFKWHYYLAVVTDITAYQGPPVKARSTLYSTIIFLDPNPILGAPHYKWSSAGVRGYLHDIYEDLHGLETGVRLNYRYPRLAGSISVLDANPNHNYGSNNGAGKSCSIALKSLTKNAPKAESSNSRILPADSGLLLLAYFEAFMKKDLFRARAAKGVPLGLINLFQGKNSAHFSSADARQCWRVALFSVLDFGVVSRERLLKQLNWTEEMVEEEVDEEEEEEEEKEETEEEEEEEDES